MGSRPLSGHEPADQVAAVGSPMADDRQISSEDQRSVKLRVRSPPTGTHQCHRVTPTGGGIMLTVKLRHQADSDTQHVGSRRVSTTIIMWADQTDFRQLDNIRQTHALPLQGAPGCAAAQGRRAHRTRASGRLGRFAGVERGRAPCRCTRRVGVRSDRDGRLPPTFAAACDERLAVR